jgi:hypothetical protein
MNNGGWGIGTRGKVQGERLEKIFILTKYDQEYILNINVKDVYLI